MTSRDFCFWLQGFFELNGSEALMDEQVECIRKHLALVFKHEIDPTFGDKEKQSQLDEIHQGYWDPSTTTIRC